MKIASLSAVAFYFNKRRPLANGITLSGVGCGMMLMPLFYRLVLDLYSWQGCLLIYGAIMLNGRIQCSLFFIVFKLLKTF